MRRSDREMPKEFAFALADQCEYAILAMVDPQNQAYCIPINLVREGDFFFFHCAKEGKKTQCLRAHPQIALVCMGKTKPLPETLSMAYESAVFQGIAQEIVSETEKKHALSLLCQRHAPGQMGALEAHFAQFLSRTAVWKIAIQEATGKRNGKA